MAWLSRMRGLLTDDASHATGTALDEGARQIATELVAALVGLSSKAIRAEDVDLEAPMFDRGYVDSLTYVELVVHVESTWGLRVSEADLVGRLSSVAALARHIADRRAPR